MREIILIIITISFLPKSLGTFVLALTNGNNTSDFESHQLLNFSVIVEENRKYKKFENYCPLKNSEPAELAVDITKVPYQVALRQKESLLLWTAFCSGTLITFRFVLTATTCFYETNEYYRKLSLVRVAAGTTRETIHSITSVTENWREIRRFYKHKLIYHNIGVIELYSDFNDCKEIKPIRMHYLDMDNDVQVNEQCVMAGYGHFILTGHSKHLKMLCMPIISRKTCERYMHGGDLYDFNICTKREGIGFCQGDEGGPLVCQGVLVGMISWGYFCGGDIIVLNKISSYTSTPKEVEFEESKSFLPIYSLILYTLCILAHFLNN